MAVLSILCEPKAKVLEFYAEKLQAAVGKLARDGAMVEWKHEPVHFWNRSGREVRQIEVGELDKVFYTTLNSEDFLKIYPYVSWPKLAEYLLLSVFWKR